MPVTVRARYAAVSISNVAATTCQYEALKFVSFPVQMLGKSSKMVQAQTAALQPQLGRCPSWAGASRCPAARTAGRTG